MYCRNCGAENTSGGAVCTQCGVMMGDGNSYCPNCGFRHDPKAVVCVKCGCQLKSISAINNKVSSYYIKNKNVFNMAQAIKVCWKKYADRTGRACRAEYWYWQLFIFLLSSPFLVLGIALVDEFNCLPYLVIIQLAFFIPSLAVSIRRLHDIGLSGWWFLLSFVPIGNLLLLGMFTNDSQDDNQYGTNPKSNKS